MAGNSNLSKARNAKNDEFYTRLEDIQEELYRYEKHFKNKIIFCNCDDPYESNFWFYFHKRFKSLGLKKLISTHYNKGRKSFKLEYTGGNDDDIYSGIKTDLKGDGDFRSDECIEILKEADVIVTNPPFSEVRTYIAQLMEYDKKFLIICNQNALTYKEVFPLFKDNKIWIGYNKPKEFYVPENTKERKNITKNAEGKLIAKFGNILWFTNLDIDKRHHPLDLVFFYEDNPEKYPKYDNYDAINVDKVANIPADYEGIMGVPITFLDKYAPEQFEIIALGCGWNGGSNLLKQTYSQNQVQISKGEEKKVSKLNDGTPLLKLKNKPNSTYYLVDGKGYYYRTYARILIKNKNPKSKKEVLGL